MKEKWKVERSKKRCSACKVDFVEGMGFFSSLYPVAGGGFMRRDFCLSCWPRFRDGEVPPLEEPDGDGQGALMPAGEYVSFWKTRVLPAEKKKTGPRFDPRVALTVFSQVVERDEKTEDEKRLLFILALSLVRRKVLRLKRMTRSGGAAYLHLSKRGGRKEFVVEDPGLSEDDIKDLLGRVGELLEMNMGDDGGGEGREDEEAEPADG